MRLKFLLIIILLFALGILYFSPQVSAQDDAGLERDASYVCSEEWINNNKAEISLEKEYQAEVNSINDVSDSYFFTIHSSGYVQVEIKNYDNILFENMEITLLRSLPLSECEINPSKAVDDYTYIEYRNVASFRFPVFIQQIQSYEPYILSFIWSGEGNLTYEFELTIDESPDLTQGDMGTQIDAINCVSGELNYYREIKSEHIVELADSTSIQISGEVGDGLVDEEGWLDYYDCYRIVADETGYISFNEIPSNNTYDSSPQFEVIDEESNSIYVGDNSLNIPLPSPRSYIFIVRGDHGQWIRNYEYNITLIPAIMNQNDANKGIDANGISNSIREIDDGTINIGVNSTLTGLMGSNYYDYYLNGEDFIDSYHIIGIENGTIEISMSLISSTDDFASIYFELREWQGSCVDVCQPIAAGFVNTNEASMVMDKRLESEELIFLSGSRDPQGYLLTLITTDDNVGYEITIVFYGNATLLDDNLLQTAKLDSLLAFIIGASLLSVTGVSVYLYRSNMPNFESIRLLNDSTKSIVQQIFGPYTSSYFVIGKNFIQKEKIDPELAKEFPSEILDHKFLLHPVRLSICKLLSEYMSLTSNELRKKLGISWSDFSTHSKALKEKGLVHLEDKIIDGSFRQMISFEPLGLEKYENLIDILIEFIDKSSIFTRYLDEALNLTDESN